MTVVHIDYANKLARSFRICVPIFVLVAASANEDTLEGHLKISPAFFQRSAEILKREIAFDFLFVKFLSSK